jgi:hypothetical protein
MPVMFVITSSGRRLEPVAVTNTNALVLIAALREFGTDDEMPSARTVADKIDAALAADDGSFDVTDSEESELHWTLDRILATTKQPLPASLQALRNALADAADLEARTQQN